MFLVRSIGLIAIKFLFARHLLGSSATNFLRALVSTISTRVIDRRRNKINAALEIYDNFPHKGKAVRSIAGFFYTEASWCSFIVGWLEQSICAYWRVFIHILKLYLFDYNSTTLICRDEEHPASSIL